MHRLILALVLVFAVSPAQAYDILTVDFRRLPFMNLKDPQSGTFEDAVKVRPARFNIKGGIPLRLPGGWTELFLGADYELIPFTYADWDFTQAASRVDSLQALSLDLSVRQKFTDSLAVRVFAKPGVFSDFSKLTSRSSRFQGGVVFEKTFFGLLTVGIGGEATQAFGTRRVLPVLTSRVKSRYFRMAGHLPESLELYFLPTANLEVGLAGRVNGGNYRIEKSGSLKGNNVRYSVGTLGPSINWRLGKHIVWTLDGGTTFLHSFSTFNSNANVRDFDLKHAAYLMSGLKLRYGAD